jgi:hypothetical protein
VSRDKLESPADREAQKAVADRLAWLWECAPIDLKPYYALDVVFADGAGIKAFAEIKCRHRTMAEMDRLGGVLLSLHKFLRAVEITDETGYPVLFVVVADDGVYWTQLERGQYDGIDPSGGRDDRNDKQDREPCVLLKAHRFQKQDMDKKQ